MKLHLILTTALVLAVVGTAVHAEEKPGHVGYDKGLYIKSDDNNFKLGTNILLQPQYQYLSIEGQDEVSTVQIRRAQFVFNGNAFTPNLTFKLQYEAVGGSTSTTAENAAVADNLLDAYLNYKYNDAINLLVGQFKPMHTREEMTSDYKLQFVDRSLATEVFGFSRSLGLAIHGKLADKKFEYSLYAVNDGNRRNRTNIDNEMLLGARALYNVLGSHGYTESDTKHSDDHLLALGVGGNYSPSTRTPNTNDIVATTADAAYMFKGFSTIVEGHWAREFTDGANTADNIVWGARGQVGYFLIPEKFEIAARGVAIIPTGVQNNGYEFAGALSYFFFDHNVKWATDYAMLVNSPLAFGGANAAGNFATLGGNPGFNQDQNDHRIRTQWQLFF